MATINRRLAILFDEMFNEELKKQVPHHKAYEQAEKRFEEIYRQRKYSSFDSFRIVRTRKIKGNKSGKAVKGLIGNYLAESQKVNDKQKAG